MPRPPSLRLASLLAACSLVALIAAACGGDEVDFSAEAVGEAFNPDVQPVIVNSALAVGPNRLTLGLFTSERALVQNAEGSLRLYRVGDDDSGALVGEHELRSASIRSETEHEHGDGTTEVHEGPFATVYYVNVDLDTAGRWGIALSVDIDGQRHDGLIASPFVALERTPEPGIGDPMPASTHLTLRDVDDVAEINSSTEPISALNELTVAEALETGKPVLVAIATPAFCQTRFCGPIMDQVVHPLYEEFGDNVQFVHVEPFLLDEARNNGRLVPVPMLDEWKLRSEPWIFVADRDGNVAAKFEGIASIEEVRETLMAVVAANPGK
jgi:hypothetical protein